MSSLESYNLLVAIKSNRFLFREVNKQFFYEKSEKCIVSTN
jgi:hypothetical protein